MKELYSVIYGGGDDAVEAAMTLAGSNEWINYEDTKPTRERRIIVCREFPDGRRYVDSIAWVRDEQCGLPPLPTLEHIKYWMPLPEPPQ